jgi:PKD repeat protein
MGKGWLPPKTGLLAVVLPLCGVLGLLSPAGAGATTITAFPVDFSTAEGAAFNGAVATFEDDNAGATPADFTATIDWGDGSPTTMGTIASSSAAFTVLGQHTYADEGTFTVTVTIADVSPGTGTATATDTASVAESDSLSGTPVSFAALAGSSFTTTVANFTDTFTGNVPSDFTATIDWGDATTSAGTITGGGAAYSVSGTHTYAGSGTFTVTVTFSDDAPGTATAQVASTAHVAGAGLNAFPVTFAATEGTAFNGVVATFTDSRAGAMVGDFTATINWGDGTMTAGTITANGGGVFSVSGMHTYGDEGSFSVPVQITDTVSAMTATTTSTANVAEGDALTGHPVTVAATAGVPFTGTVATFTDTFAGNVPSDFLATINWGDATVTAGTVTGGSGTFSVSGTHTYAAPGTYTVTVTLTDDAPGTATATATSTANVGNAPIAVVPALDWRGLAALTLALAGTALLLLRKTRARV